MKNIGIIGKMGSGKGFIAKYLSKRYGYKIINLGNIVRALARKEKLKPTRKNLEKLQKKYSKIYKQDYVIEKVIEKSRNIKKPIILDGIRKPIQAKLAKDKLNAVLIGISANPEIRFERMKKRRRENFPKSLKKFLKVEKEEEKIFNLNKTLKMTRFKINNSDGKLLVYKNLNNIIKKIKQKS